jgi:hypothetical protein
VSANAGKNGVANGGKVWEMAILVMRVGVPGALPFFLSEIFEADLLLSFLKVQFFKLSGVILSTDIACGLCTFFYHIPLATRLFVACIHISEDFFIMFVTVRESLQSFRKYPSVPKEVGVPVAKALQSS